jgi:hypothetical protein
LKNDAEVWQEDKVVVMNCRLSDKDGENKLICNQVRELDVDNVTKAISELNGLLDSNGNGRHYRSFKKENNPKDEVLIRGNAFVLMPSTLDQDLTQRLKNIFNAHPGRYKMILVTKDKNSFKKIATNFLVAGNDLIKAEIEALLGKNSFKLREYQD